MSNLYDDLAFCEYHTPNTGKDGAKRKKFNNKNNSSSSVEWTRKQLYLKEWSKIDRMIDSRIQTLLEQFLCDFVQTEMINSDQSINMKKIPTTIMTLNTPSLCKKLIHGLDSMLNDCDEKNLTILIQLDPSHDTMRNILQQFQRTFSQQQLFDDNFNLDILQTIEDVLKLAIKTTQINGQQDDNLRMKFHPNLIEKLSENFERKELSFEYFRHLMQIIVFDYFNQNPLSIICDEDFQSYKDDDFASCFRNSLNILSLQQIPFDDEYIDKLSKCYEKLLKKNFQSIQCLNIVLQLFNDLSIPVGHFTNHYSKFFKQKSPDEKSVEHLHLERLYDVTQNRMKNALEKLKLTNQHLMTNNPALNVINDYLVKLDELINRDKLEQAKQNESIRQLGLECQVEMVKDKLRNINSRYEWKRTLKPLAKQNLSQYEQWKNNFIGQLEQSLVDCHFNDEERKLIDALFCNIFSMNHLSYRLNIDKALTEPTNHHDGGAALGDSYPSFYIIYNFYKESGGNQVNLNEWYEKFCEEKKLSKNSMEKNDDEMFMAWFLNTILDFEFIGLLKNSAHNKYICSVYIEADDEHP
ncbi:hypothetical protein HUG17_1025 [Dermatophagoides farinae]|uniref:Origin recognition complex subunit 3 winged helix C-terminal domain-containing protein n=1 Tax=Dermatophagoides farinae TaxID=6954 RepID=A0A9D4SKV2_DERFA|nr:hypothetical protein HUG17_1025 [Dermatophagoides farinae]